MILCSTSMFLGREAKKIGLEISEMRETALFAKFKWENSIC